MYQEPIFLQPVFKEKIWGGNHLQEVFNYAIPSEHTGEAWVISALEHGTNIVESGSFKGQTLRDLWENHKELFNKPHDLQGEYPLLVKLLDANDDLSVQVHPDDHYAKKVEHVPYGKTECWYVVRAAGDAELIIGHHAQSKQELHDLIEAEKWDELLHYQEVKQGDFFYVPSGTIHAIGKGIMILEIQQSSDTTYRVYDYDRKDDKGETRELHLEKAKEVTTVPHPFQENKADADKVFVIEGLRAKTLIESTYFSVYHWQLNGEATYTNAHDYLQVSVLEGQANLMIQDKTYAIEKGQHFILPYGVREFTLSGKAELVISHE